MTANLVDSERLTVIQGLLDGNRLSNRARGSISSAEYWTPQRTPRARASRKKSRTPLPLYVLDGWPSGLRRTPGKRVHGKPCREFESRPIRFQTFAPFAIAIASGVWPLEGDDRGKASAVDCCCR